LVEIVDGAIHPAAGFIDHHQSTNDSPERGG
jgi:hypothetical protein